jgi:hypothetical protein
LDEGVQEVAILPEPAPLFCSKLGLRRRLTPLLVGSHVGVGVADGVVEVVDETGILLESALDVVVATIEDEASIEDEVEMMLDAVDDGESIAEEDETVLLGCTEVVTR